MHAPSRNSSSFASPVPEALRTSSSSVEHLPVNLFASVMGLSGLALAWRVAGQTFGASIAISSGIGMLAVLAFLLIATSYLVKTVRYTGTVRKEFTHPVAGNFFGSITISLLLLSAVIEDYSTPLQHALWTAGVASTVVLSVIVVNRLMRGSAAPGAAVPAWLIPGVATLDIAVTGATMPMAWAHEVNLLAVAIGSVLAVVFFVMIFSRLVHCDPLPAAMTPSLMVLVAPFEVGFLAYLNMVQRVDMFASMLFYFGLFMFIVVSLRIFRALAPFAASWWAIGFPLAALAIASLKYAAATGSAALTVLAAVLLAVLSAAIAILLARTLHALFSGKLLSA